MFVKRPEWGPVDQPEILAGPSDGMATETGHQPWGGGKGQRSGINFEVRLTKLTNALHVRSRQREEPGRQVNSAPAELGGWWRRVHRQEDGLRGGRQGSRVLLGPCCDEGACDLLVDTLSWILCYHKARQAGRLEKQTFAPLRTGGWKSKLKAAAGSVSGEGPLPGSSTVSSARVLTW